MYRTRDDRLKEDRWTKATTLQSKVYRTRDDRLREDRWTETTTLQSKVYRTRGDRLWEDRWTETTTLQSKMYRTRGDRQKTAKFIAVIGLPVQANKATEKKTGEEETYSCSNGAV